MSDPFSYAVIGKAMEVHRELGPGVDEIFYHDQLTERLCAAGIEHLCRPRWLDRAAGKVLPIITGTASVNAEATQLLDDQDPFCWGIR